MRAAAINLRERSRRPHGQGSAPFTGSSLVPVPKHSSQTSVFSCFGIAPWSITIPLVKSKLTYTTLSYCRDIQALSFTGEIRKRDELDSVNTQQTGPHAGPSRPPSDSSFSA